MLTKVKYLGSGPAGFTVNNLYTVMGWGDGGGNIIAFVINDNGDVARAQVDGSVFELASVDILGNIQIYP